MSEKVKLPRNSYEELRKLILGYHYIGKPSGLQELAQTTGMARTTISSNNAFLLYIGVVEGANKKSLTETGSRLARAIEHEIIIEVQKLWSEIISDNEFLTKMIQAVKVRRGMEYAQLENHIAFSSGESKNSKVMTGARAVIDIFLSAGALVQDGEKLIVNDHVPGLNESPHPGSRSNINNSEDVTEPEIITEPHYDEKNTQQIYKKEIGQVSLKIELLIKAGPEELEGLGKRIKQIIDEVNE